MQIRMRDNYADKKRDNYADNYAHKKKDLYREHCMEACIKKFT